MQQAEAASSGAAQSGFPSREAVAQAGAELAQRLGLAPDQALDKIVSTVLQQGWGGERGLSVMLLTQVYLADAACSWLSIGVQLN